MIKNRSNEISEIKDNFRELFLRVTIILILLVRFFIKSFKRTQQKTYQEYNNYWNSFWESKDILRTDLAFTNFDIPIIPPISPLEARKESIIKIIERVINEKNVHSVLEIGSGTGLNLIILSQMFPHVQFYGIEPTECGVKMSKKMLDDPPSELLINTSLKNRHNVTIIQGNALDSNCFLKIKDIKFDLIFTSAVIEQLNNYHEIFFENILKINFRYFLFYEEWLEANLTNGHYFNLVRWDYFRISWNYLNKYHNFQINDRFIPGVQPSWLKYGVVFGEKNDDPCNDI